MNCIFCKIISGELTSQRIAENDTLIVIQDIMPKAQIHYLIIPKKHIQDIQAISSADRYIGADIFSMAHYLSRTIENAHDFKLHINSGKSAGQVIMHLHAHFVSGPLRDAL